jgi:hypothetical protein
LRFKSLEGVKNIPQKSRNHEKSSSYLQNIELHCDSNHNFNNRNLFQDYYEFDSQEVIIMVMKFSFVLSIQYLSRLFVWKMEKLKRSELTKNFLPRTDTMQVSSKAKCKVKKKHLGNNLNQFLYCIRLLLSLL